MTAFFKGRSSRIRGEFVDLAHAPAPTLKIACVVSKKSLPRAVDRNRVRRRIKAALSRAAFQTTTPLVLVFTVRAPAATTTFKALALEVVQLAEKAVLSYNGRI